MAVSMFVCVWLAQCACVCAVILFMHLRGCEARLCLCTLRVAGSELEQMPHAGLDDIASDIGDTSQLLHTGICHFRHSNQGELPTRLTAVGERAEVTFYPPLLVLSRTSRVALCVRLCQWLQTASNTCTDDRFCVPHAH